MFHRFSSGVLTLFCIIAGMVVASLTGCGGGGVAEPTTTPLRLSIAWGARSRDPLLGPSSALSAIITLKGGRADGADLVMTVNRHADPAGYIEAYTSEPALARLGAFPLTARFLAAADGTGAVVGEAHSAAVTLTAAGSDPGTISTVGTVATVAVDAGQFLAVGETKPLAFSARTSDGTLLALSPGAAHWVRTAGTAFALDGDGSATGESVGAAQVTATVDGIGSAAESVVVEAPPVLPTGTTASAVRTISVAAAPGGTWHDPLTGLDFTFPNGATGALTTMTLDVAPPRPITGGQGFAICAPGAPVIITRTAAAEMRPYMMVYGTARAFTDGGNVDTSAPRWMMVPGVEANGAWTFALPAPPVRTRQIGNSTPDIGWTGEVPRMNALELQAMQDINNIIAHLNEPTKSSLKARVDANHVSVALIPPMGMLGENSSSYQSNLYGWRVLTYITGGDTLHEVGHYVTHMMMTDAQFEGVMDIAAPAGHAIGIVATNRNIGDDYAYVIEQWGGSNYANLGALTSITSFLKPRAGRALEPSKEDLPGMEGFGAQLMGYMARDAIMGPDFTGSSSAMPAVGATPTEIIALMARGAATNDALRPALEALAATRGHTGAVQVLAERVGWSYHATGKLQWPNGDPGANLKVQAVCTVDGVEYVTPIATSAADGTIKLPRLFPGTSTIRVIDGDEKYETTETVDWSRKTPQEVDMGTIVLQEDPNLTWLKSAKHLGVTITAVAGGSMTPWTALNNVLNPNPEWLFTWSGREFTFTAKEKTSNNVSSVSASASGEVSADASMLISLNMTSTLLRRDESGNIANTDKWDVSVRNVPISGAVPHVIGGTASYQGGEVISAHYSNINPPTAGTERDFVPGRATVSIGMFAGVSPAASLTRRLGVGDRLAYRVRTLAH